jgi:alkylation response protein AidB-like acyl-CoA dehydrogenase
MSADPQVLVAMLSDSVERYIERSYGFESRSAYLESKEGFSARAWNDYAELGWLALRLPEQLGGMGADTTAIAALMSAAGRGLLLEPLLSSAVLATGLLLKAGCKAQQEELLPQLADGSMIIAFAYQDAAGQVCRLRSGKLSGAKVNVLHGNVAGRMIVSCSTRAGAALALLDVGATGVERRVYRLIDGRFAAQLQFNEVKVELLDATAAEEAIARTIDEACVALCAEDSGIIAALLSITTQYVKVRKQFGRPIGANQALQHRLADIYMCQEEAAALTADACAAADAEAPERAVRIAGARAYIAAVARKVANEAVQMHGGLGITEELAVSHYFRRVMVNSTLFGSRLSHFERFLNDRALQHALHV